ncbi:hypothetical protein D3C72_2580180 [compost metagenome]
MIMGASVVTLPTVKPKLTLIASRAQGPGSKAMATSDAAASRNTQAPTWRMSTRSA